MSDQVKLTDEFGTAKEMTEEEILKLQKESGRDAKIDKLEEGVFKKKVLLEEG